ncbi:MAG TPA: outer membrane protein assembly factor BamA [Deltaproteobacteria bacterium]|nr:outer membrane protein assembly factor BamA [Deltaproteobacteria bacterium]
MNRTSRSLLAALVACMLAPFPLLGAGLELMVSDKEASAHLEDVPCVTVSPVARASLFVERTEGMVTASDGRVTYRAATLPEALDGYLRLMGVCVAKDVVIRGTQRISNDAVRFRIKTAKGDIIHKGRIKKDIEEIYAMGYFEKCDASFEDDVVIFDVSEYPVIMSIELKGNEEIKEKELLDAIGMKKFDILNTRQLKTAIERIKSQYRQRGYYGVEVSTSTTPTEGGVVLTFTVVENEQLYIRGISFDGNENIKAGKLSGVMETKTRWPLGIFGHEGAYDSALLDNDLLRIEQYYADNGYMQAKVGRPRVDIREKDGIYITIPVSEGPLFTVGAVEIEGDLVEPKERLMEKVALSTGSPMSKSALQQSVENLRSVYMDKGYAYAKIRPVTEEEGENRLAVTFRIDKGKPVVVENIQIRGNTKTRDKVIRRELEIEESKTFSSTAIKDSKDNLSRLGYFSTVNIDPVPKSDSSMDLLVDVQETTTGAFSFGFAYSSSDGPMGTTSLSENNFFGLGYKVKGSIDYGPKRKSYSIDAEDPWFLDYNLSLGGRVYNLEREYIYYTKRSVGGNIRLSYPLFERVRHSVIYAYENVHELDDIDPAYLQSLSEEEIEGGVTSSVINTISRTTTNDYFRPTRGSQLTASLEYAGLGGDYHFTRTTASAARFFPLWADKLALMLKVRWGTVNPAKGDKLPEYERFDLGGLGSIRGFKWGEVGPQDSLGNFIGGRRMVVMNIEATFPIGPIPGLYGVLFHDEGNCYDKRIDLTNLKKSYGAGIRWVTPMGPLRLEYARVINPEDWEEPSRWEFSIGSFF